MSAKITSVVTAIHDPVLTVSRPVEFEMEGEIGRRLRAVTEQWILPAPAANPAMLGMFRERDRKPYRYWSPWVGEFAGKYLTHSAQILRLTGDARLRFHLEHFVKEMCACQDADGYLGCWPQDSRMTNHAPNSANNWDTWSHYHSMLGLMLWNEVSGDNEALSAATKIADLLCEIYLGEKTPRLVDTGSTEMNLAPIHSLCLLYRKTGLPRYLALARQILEEFAAKDATGIPLAGDYLQAPLAGQDFFQTPKPRWESLHPIMGLVELYYLTGDESCRKAFESLWWSMLSGDRHNNGGFTSGEKATGNPYNVGAIETCCTVAWMAMSVEMLRLTGSSPVADELELSMLNSGLGMMSPSGRWVTYNTPMDGVRKASAHDIVFQARAGSSELNCCSVNGPRALGLLGEWALMHDKKGLTLNYYGPGSMKTSLHSGNTVTVKQDTDYPRNAVINLSISTTMAETFTLALRIPCWSRKTHVQVNGQELENVKSGDYLRIERQWTDGDKIRLEMDFQLQFWRHPAMGYVDANDWEAEWLLGGPVINKGNSPAWLPAEELLLDKAATMADVMCAGNGAPVRVHSTAGYIDFNKIFSGAGAHAAVWCFTEIDAPSDGTLPILSGCDWRYSCFVNGQEVLNDSGVKDRRHLTQLPLKAGRNLIGFRITAGTDGWTLNIGKGAFIQKGKESSNQVINYASIYRGPVLLAYDARFNDGDYSPEGVPHLAQPALELLQKWERVPSDNPLILLEGRDTDGNAVRYCDFASAGATGNYYQSWVPVGFQCPELEFSSENPRRSSAID